VVQPFGTMYCVCFFGLPHGMISAQMPVALKKTIAAAMTPSQITISPTPEGRPIAARAVHLLWIFSVFLVFGFLDSMKGAVFVANSPMLSDVQTAVNETHDGDTVKVPAGTGVWASNLIITNSILLQGAGSNSTFIVDNNLNRNISGCLISATVDNNAESEISGFCFMGTNNGAAEDFSGEIEIAGTCFQLRFDHCYCTNYNGPMLIIYGWVYGVADHDCFIANFRQGAQLYTGATYGGSLYGDGSWAAPETLGSGNAFFFENDYFYNQALDASALGIDMYDGSRAVFRYNYCVSMAPDTHGTDSSQRERGFRTLEVYNNFLTNAPGDNPQPGQFRGGTGLCYSNTYSAAYGAIMDMETYRSFFSGNAYFGGGTGANPWDSNSPTIYASGVCSSVSGGRLTMTDSSQGWTVNQWANYSLYDVNTGYGSVITANTANTITFVDGSSVSGGGYLNFSVNDHYQVRKPIYMIDQDGMGQGDLLAENSNYQPYDSLTGTTNWPNEKIEPIYYWSNTVGGVLTESAPDNSPTVVLNRNYYLDTIPAGYTPYTYPHPLDSSNYNGLSTGGTSYTLTVVNGSGGGSYTANSFVGVSANTIAGEIFTNWSGPDIANTNLASTTVAMPAANLTITANYISLPTSYTLTVVNGTGGGSYNPGSVVSISANAIANQTFTNWIGLDIVNTNLASTTVIMPASSLTVTANFAPYPPTNLHVIPGQ
jgi:Divergent InlB B-repeat domain